MSRLMDAVRAAGRRLVVPLLGYPGARLTRSSLRQNAFNPALHCESISRLADRFAPDAVFFMMDLSIEAGALGLPVRYPLHESPTVEEHPVHSLSDLDAFQVLDPMDDALVQARIKTMALMKERLNVPRGGYVIGPFTLAGLLMGASDLAMATITEPELAHGVVGFCADVCVRYARALANAGADIIAILEPTASLLSPRAFDTFCCGHLRSMIMGLAGPTVQQAVRSSSPPRGSQTSAPLNAQPHKQLDAQPSGRPWPVSQSDTLSGSAAQSTSATASPEWNGAPMTILHICGDTSHLVKSMCATGAQGLSLDSPVDLATAAREADPETVLIGNIDPVGVVSQGTPEDVRRAVRGLLDRMAPYENFILSTGCDVPYETPFENIDALMREGRA